MSEPTSEVVSIVLTATELRGDDLRSRVPAVAAAAHHSVSHTPGLSAIAWSDMRVGIDLERVRARPMLDRLAARTMLANERDVWRTAADPDRAFAQHWTRVEAYLKAIGEGVRGGYLTRPPAGWSIVDLDLAAPHVGAIAAECDTPVVSVSWLRGPLEISG